MNATTLKVVGSPAAKGVSRTQMGDARGDLSGRLSPELVIALSGPVGCGIELVRKGLEDQLDKRGYRVEHIKVTAHFKELAADLGVPDQTHSAQDEYHRISSYQDLGNELREVLGEDLGAQIALRAIALARLRSADAASGEPVDPERVSPKRVAYVIDQLKNPKEVQLLRDVYGNLFFLIGVLSGYERRKRNLIAKRMTEPQAVQLMDRDRAEVRKDGRGSGGQQLEKTLKSADFFLRNVSSNSRDLSAQLGRFVDLLHGEPGITPTIAERGMYAAYSAAMRSACLSRQVGAAILSPSGAILSTGCNDVPRRGGGLYEYGDPNDHRCVNKEGGVCFNDRHKDLLCEEIKAVVVKHGVEAAKAQEIAATIRSSTRLRDLIEFSRAVHAEMDALISVARQGGNSVKGAILFTTTYPCHNCARHIVAAGISNVYFIEPYAKSLAIELHEDDIVHDPDDQGAWGESRADGKVAFLNFEGVSPNRFADLFYSLDGRKDSSGRAVRLAPASAPKKSPEFLDNYIQLESRVTRRIEEKIAARKAQGGSNV